MKQLEYKGKVLHGDGYGRQIGFPTANLDRRQWARQRWKVQHGIYAGKVILSSGKEYFAGVVIGPVDKKGLPKVEAHLIGYKGNLYEQTLIFQFIKFIRPFHNFPNTDSLKKQISKDLKEIIKFFKHE